MNEDEKKIASELLGKIKELPDQAPYIEAYKNFMIAVSTRLSIEAMAGAGQL